MIRLCGIAPIVAALVLPRPAAAITSWSSTAHLSATLTQPGTTCGTGSVEIHADSGFTGGTIYIWDANGCQSLSAVTFSSDSGASGTIYAIIGAIHGGVANGFQDISSIDASGASLPVNLSFYANRDVGDVTVTVIASGNAGRNLDGPITATFYSGTPSGINLSVGNATYTGTIRGDVTSAGKITSVNCHSTGTIEKTDGSAVTFIATEFDGIITTGTCHANFYGPSGGSDPNFKKLTVATGDLTTDMRLAGIASGAGTGIFVSGSGAALVGTIRLSGSLPSSASIQVPSGGLEGQVIINADGTSGAWSGTVHVNGASLTSPPYYSEDSSSVGGGAVGLVPFHLYDSDCDPPNGVDGCSLSYNSRTWTAAGGGDRETIILRHYGPVFSSADPSVNPLIIKAQSWYICTPTPCPGEYGVLTSWTDESSDFDVYVEGNGSRDVWVARKLDEDGNPRPISTDYAYQISLVESGGATTLRSDGTTAATAPNVIGYPYEISPICESRPAPSRGQ